MRSLVGRILPLVFIILIAFFLIVGVWVLKESENYNEVKSYGVIYRIEE